MLKIILILTLFQLQAYGLDGLLPPAANPLSDEGSFQFNDISDLTGKSGKKQTGSSLYFASPKNVHTKYKIDEAGGNVFIGDMAEEYKELTGSGISKKNEFRDKFCDRLKQLAISNGHYFTQTELTKNAENGVERIQSVSSSIIQEYASKSCSGPNGVIDTSGNCFKDLLADFDKSGNFDEACKNQADSYLLSGANDIDLSRALVSDLNKYAKKVGNKHAASEKPNRSACAKGNCAFSNPDGYYTDCNALKCNVTGDNDALLNITEPLAVISMDSSTFNVRGSDKFCNECFREAAKDNQQDFPIEEVEKKFKNKVAGRLAAKEILGFARMIELASDYNSLTQSNKEAFCPKGLEKMLSDKCGSKEMDAVFEERIKEASDYIGIDIEQDSFSFFKALANKVNEKGEDQTCTRADFAFKKVNAFLGPKNDELRAGMKSVVSQLNSEPLKEEVSKICENNSPEGTGSVSEFLSEKLAEKMVNMIAVMGRENSASLQGDWKDMACASNVDGFIRTVGCNDSQFAKENPANRFFQTFHRDHEEIIAAIKQNFSNVGEDGRVDQVHFKHLLEDMKMLLKSQFKSTLDLASTYDPIIGLNLESWKNTCALMGRADDKIENLIMQNPYSKGMENLAEDYCARTISKAKSQLCSDPEVERGEDLALSKRDLDEIRDALIKEENGRSSMAINSLSCRLNSKNLSTNSKLALGSGNSFEISDLEKSLAKGNYPLSPMDYETFKNESSCNEESRKLQSNTLAAVTDRYLFTAIDSSGDSYAADRLSQEAVITNAKLEEQLDEERQALRTSLGWGGGSSLVSGARGRVSSSGTSAMNSFLAGTGASSVASTKGENSKTRPTEPAEKNRLLAQSEQNETESGKNTNGTKQEDLFSYMSNTSSSFDSGSSASASRSPANYSATPICDNECLQEVLRGQKGNISNTEDKQELASKLGIKNPEQSSEDMKKMFEDVLEGKLNEKELDKLKAENEQLRKEMAEIKKDMESRPVKVIDQNGVDRTTEIQRPESNPSLVLNPRNTNVAEYRSRSSMQEKADQFSPDYSTAPAERVSLGDYRSSRREAAKVPVDQVKNYNAEMDQTFLRANSSSAVDDGFVKRYVSHINKEAGSIEHLIVFENGVPARIRVPDPQRPGAYVEHPLEGEMAQEILGQVEKNEVQSFALYNMVSFGDSLSEFMKNLDTEASNITSLRSLNSRLSKLKELD